MSYAKQAEAARYHQPENDAPPPAYDDAGDAALGESSPAARAASRSMASAPAPAPAPAASSSSSSHQNPGTNDSHQASSSASTSQEPQTGSTKPTPDPALDLPALPPAYTPISAPSSSSSSPLPIAIPQTSPLPYSPFLRSYPPSLLPYGIPPSSFHPFLSNLSSILGANASNRALSHAGDIGRSIGSPSKASFRSVVAHTKTVGKDISAKARKGNIIGAAVGVVGGTITIPLAAVGGLISSAASLPGTTIAAAVQRPKTTRQRAEAYVNVANEKWFAERGLEAALVDTKGLGSVLGGVDVGELAAENGQGRLEVLRRLERWVERLDVEEDEQDKKDLERAPLEISSDTLWLVILKVARQREGYGEEQDPGVVG